MEPHQMPFSFWEPGMPESARISGFVAAAITKALVMKAEGCWFVMRNTPVPLSHHFFKRDF